MKRELVIVIDFGGQYNQLVARRVRECNVYCEIYSYKTDLEKIKEMNPKGIILTGGPNLFKRIIRDGNSGTWTLLWCTAHDARAWWKSREGRGQRIW